MTVPSPVFQVWDETGSTPLGVLQGVSDWAISDVLCDLGALTLTVPLDVVGAEHLLADADRQVCVKWRGGPDMWFVNDDDAWAGVSDAPESEPRQCALRSLAAVLDEVYTENTFTFGTAGDNAGNVASVILVDAHQRNYLQGITFVGDGNADATGQPWPDPVEWVVKAGTSVLSVLKELSGAHLLEWRMNGRAVELHAPGAGLDRTRPFLRPGADVAAAPVTRSRKEIATDALIIEEDGTVVTRSQTLPGRRRRQVLVDAVQDVGSGFIGDLYLATHSASDVQLSHDLQDGEDSPAPWVDFRPGDRLPTVAAGGGISLWRVAQLAVAQRGDQVTVSAELGSLLKGAEERAADQLAHLHPGKVVLT